jgi:hypothetical protein
VLYNQEEYMESDAGIDSSSAVCVMGNGSGSCSNKKPSNIPNKFLSDSSFVGWKPDSRRNKKPPDIYSDGSFSEDRPDSPFFKLKLGIERCTYNSVIESVMVDGDDLNNGFKLRTLLAPRKVKKKRKRKKKSPFSMRNFRFNQGDHS